MSTKGALLRALSALDRNGSGAVEQQHLGHILKSLNPDTWTDANLGTLFTKFAAGQGGKVQLEEFLTFVLGTMPVEYPEVTPGSKHYALDPESDDGKYLAKKIWWFGPKFSPKDVPAFYDISSISEDPECFRKVIDIFVERYRGMGEKGPTHVLGYDARGFILGPPIALELSIPFVLFRKDAKHPGVVVESSGYSKEYAEKKLDSMCMRLGAIKPGARVLLIDDLVATGGTALAGFELCNSCGIDVCEFAAVIDLPFCKGIEKIREYGGGRFKDVPVFTLVDGRQIPDENGRDPPKWEEESRVVPAPKAREMMAKYPDLD